MSTMFEPEIGDFAKISFEDKEAMWIKITKIRQSPIWQGTLTSNPLVCDLKFGDVIEFEIAEVIQYKKGDDVK